MPTQGLFRNLGSSEFCQIFPTKFQKLIASIASSKPMLGAEEIVVEAKGISGRLGQTICITTVESEA